MTDYPRDPSDLTLHSYSWRSWYSGSAAPPFGDAAADVILRVAVEVELSFIAGLTKCVIKLKQTDIVFMHFYQDHRSWLSSPYTRMWIFSLTEQQVCNPPPIELSSIAIITNAIVCVSVFQIHFNTFLNFPEANIDTSISHDAFVEVEVQIYSLGHHLCSHHQKIIISSLE